MKYAIIIPDGCADEPQEALDGKTPLQAADVPVFLVKAPLFNAAYDRQKARGKHHTVALSHVAHKMLHVIFSVLKNKRPYTPMLN